MANQALRLVVPTPVNGTVPPRRKPNSETRDREHLTEAEVERLMKAAGKNRYGHRDATMILIAFRHGLRPVEVCNLKWDSIDLAKARIHVNRAKNGEPSTHPLSGVELRALRRLKRESIESLSCLFPSVVRALHDGRLSQDDCTAVRGGQVLVPGAPAHVPPRLRVQAGQ